MIQQKVVITGGPATGKTSLIKELESRELYCFHEVIREMTLEAKDKENTKKFNTNPIAVVEDSLSFNRKILNARIKHFEVSNQLSNEIVFFDRGIPDVLGYMDFYNQPYDSSFTEPCLNNIYDWIFILPPWEEIYASDDERFESYEEALQIHFFLEKIYEQFGYSCIKVPFGPIEERVDFILERIHQ